MSYDCFQKQSNYDVNGNKQSWTDYYFRNNHMIWAENSYGSKSEMTYDSRGNLIRDINSDKSSVTSEERYEYNDFNKRTKESSFSSGKLDYTRVLIYKDTLMIKTYTSYFADNTSDTTWYYYNELNKPDSAILPYGKAYFYYSPEIDSIVISDNDIYKIQTRRYFRYKAGKKIYERNMAYSSVTDDFYRDDIRSWEYNQKLMLVRSTESLSDKSGIYNWGDQRNIYNESDLLIKTEYYDEENNLKSYIIDIYNNSNVIKFEFYNSLNELTGYSLYENSCKK